MRVPGRSRMTLLEAVIAAALASVVALLFTGALFATRRSTSVGLGQEAADAAARRVVESLANELRDLNRDDQDVEPDLAALGDFAPTVADRLRYRTVVGFEAATGVAQLSPSRASGTFRELYLSGTDVVLSTPRTGGTVVIAREIAELRVQLSGSMLRVRVTCDRRHPDEPGKVLRSVGDMTVQLHNALLTAD